MAKPKDVKWREKLKEKKKKQSMFIFIHIASRFLGIHFWVSDVYIGIFPMSTYPSQFHLCHGSPGLWVWIPRSLQLRFHQFGKEGLWLCGRGPNHLRVGPFGLRAGGAALRDDSIGLSSNCKYSVIDMSAGCSCCIIYPSVSVSQSV